MVLRIPSDVRVELIDGIAVEYFCNMFIRLMAVQRSTDRNWNADGNTTPFELQLEPHSFQEMPIGERLIRLSATGFYDFGLQVEVLDNRLAPLTFDEVRPTFKGLGLGATCGGLKRSEQAWNGIWHLRTKGRCRVGVGQYSGSVLYIEHPPNTETKDATE